VPSQKDISITTIYLLYYFRRGSLLSTAIFVYAATSPVNGYFGGSLYARMGGEYILKVYSCGLICDALVSDKVENFHNSNCKVKAACVINVIKIAKLALQLIVHKSILFVQFGEYLKLEQVTKKPSHIILKLCFH
jgi:hypothetical protein